MKNIFILSLAVAACLSVTVPASAETSVIQKTASCSKSNFIGEAKVDVTLVDGTAKKAAITKYKITKISDQKGGNKANINLKAESGRYIYFPPGYGRFEGVSSKSSDNNRQDGEWNNLTGVNLSSTGMLRSMSVEFIFDKSGADPSCEAPFW
jgi:hypothetical protein